MEANPYEPEPGAVALSKCCNAEAKICGDDKEGTYYYSCSKCHKPCDITEPKLRGIVCPFCTEVDFDKEGLKYHLENYCTIYKEVDNV